MIVLVLWQSWAWVVSRMHIFIVLFLHMKKFILFLRQGLIM